MIRDCDEQGQQIEIYIKIEVLINFDPVLAITPKTSFTLSLGETEVYEIPNAIDPDDNSWPIIYLDSVPDKELKYPPFLNFDNSTNLISLEPQSIWVRGKTYFFNIVVREASSDSAMTTY